MTFRAIVHGVVGDPRTARPGLYTSRGRLSLEVFHPGRQPVKYTIARILFLLPAIGRAIEVLL